MKKLTFFTLILSCFLLSCEKEKLTKATQIGANTFSCKVNGQILIPNNEAFSVDAISTSLVLNEDPNFYNLKILTNYSKTNPSKKIYLTIYKINSIGVYIFSGSDFRYGEYFISAPDNKEYNSRTSNIGEVKITKLDLANKIVSGTFSFEATNKNDPNDKVSITDGRFDLRLR
ncbi:DUF6252 family protein [Pedobacter cryophilus]|uniref:Lipoprotein n=1 Tax=Pedobacter cryophilus TaxID=2571271 RepID=A0A4U1C4N4_9SPHI|nr:DUF6252 family protein [Pedobacter cryophilus]TKC00353.1 hypothetical protein FA046_01340 [Pedobacter cryophilus]